MLPVLFLAACRGDVPTKTDAPPVVPIAQAPPKVEIEPEEKPAPKAAPPVIVEEVPTPITQPKPIVPEPPKDTKPTVKEPGKAGKDPKESDKEPKFVVPKAVLGRNFDAWKVELKSKDPSRREKAMRTILLFGPDKAYEALPELIAELAKHNKPTPIDLAVRVNGVFAMSSIFFGKKDPEKEVVDDAIVVYKMFLKDRQVVLRTRTVQGVLSLGGRAQELINEIIEVAHDPNTGDVRKEGIVALTRIGVGADKKVHPKVPIELRKALDDSSGQVKLAALQGLVALGPAFDKKEKDLTLDKVKAFLKKKETDPFLQMTAHVTIMLITGTVDKAHLTPLVKMVSDKDEMHRTQALQFLKLFGPKAQGAIDDVIAATTDGPTWQTRKAALETAMLLALDKNELHPAILPALRNALNDKAPEVRQASLNGLTSAKAYMDNGAMKTTVASLKKFAKTEKEPLLEILAHATIMTLTDDISPTHLEPIIDMLKHKDVPVRRESLRTIGLAGSKAKPYVLTAVVGAIRDPDLTISEAAIDTLPSIHAFETMDMLKKIVADKKADPVIIEAAEDAIVLMEEMMSLEKTSKEKTEKK